MPDLVVEDGTIISGANSFVDLDHLDDYHEARGNTSWTSIANDETKEIAAIRGLVYLNSLNWKGYRSDKDQTTCFPRVGIEDADGYAWESNEIPWKGLQTGRGRSHQRKR